MIKDNIVFIILVLFTVITAVVVSYGMFVVNEMYPQLRTEEVRFDEVKGFETTDCLLITNYKDFIQQDHCYERPVIIRITI